MKLDTSKVMASFEAIEYQGRRSKMFSEITFFFQEIIDYRDDLIKKGTPNKELARLVRKKTHDEIDGLAAILRKYTRIKYRFKLVEGSISLAFYTLFNPDEAYDGSDIPGPTKLDPKNDDNVLKRLEKFRKGVDKTTGKLPKQIDDTIMSNESSMILCIDSMFLMKMYHSKIEDLSAPELTFIIMHETAHTLMWAYNADTTV